MNINITEDLLNQCAEAGRAAAYAKQSELDATEFMWVGPDDEEDVSSRQAFARAVIETWEASRTPGQLERTNHALALELAEANAAKKTWIATAEKLKADVAELNERLHERTQLFLTKWPRGVLPPWPVVKVDSQGRDLVRQGIKEMAETVRSLTPDDFTRAEIEWNNPEEFSQQKIGQTFRMLVKGERMPPDGEYHSGDRWVATNSANIGETPPNNVTYRTATPLPNPLPR